MLEANKDFKRPLETVIDYIRQNESKLAMIKANASLAIVSNNLISTSAAIVNNQQLYMDQVSDENTKEVHSILFRMLLIGVAAILFSFLTAFFLSRWIVKPIKLLASASMKIANGELAFDNLQIKNGDEIGELAQSFNRMRVFLSEMIFRVGESSERVSAASEQLTASSEVVCRSSESIKLSMEAFKGDIDMQMESVADGITIMGEMSEAVSQITDYTNAAIEVSRKATDMAVAGNSSVNSAMVQMSTIDSRIQELTRSVNDLSNRSKHIGNIVLVISEIAKQTNLLSLNASIEAARAGVHGRGFTVVAQGIRKLAGQCADASKEISGLISGVHKEMDRVIQSTHLGTAEVVKGTVIIKEAEAAFEKIKNAVHDASQQVKWVAVASNNIANKKVQVIERIEIIEQAAKKNHKESLEVSNIADKQYASMEEITASSIELMSMSVSLQEMLSRFTTGTAKI
jgi:methyl-accepting chemotaxis protein